MTKYAFGDSAIAAERLSLLARTYADCSRTFLRESIGFRPSVAADLGCGPGFSTHLLANTLNPLRTIGFDNSKKFLADASAAATGSVTFENHDITKAPFPHGPFDLMFGRFVLTHLRDPKSVIESWVSQLRPGGVLLIEEVESIESDILEFATYLGIQQSMLSWQGNSLYVGTQIGAIAEFNNARLKSNGVAYLRVPPSRAASMFQMNLSTIKDNDFVRAHYDSGTLDRLDAGLAALARIGSNEPAVRWGLRQMTLERIGCGKGPD